MDAAAGQPIAVQPTWPRRIRLTRRGAAAVSVLAVLADSAAVAWDDRVQGSYLVLAVSLAGALLALASPAWGLAVTVGGCAVAAAIGADLTTSWTITVFTLLSATLAGVPAVRAGGLVVGALYGLLVLSEGRGAAPPVALTAASTAAAAAAIGGGIRAQWRYLMVLEQRAADAVAAQQRESAQALVEERMQIARDLHDLVGHEVAVLNMHLGVAEVSLPAGSERAAASLAAARAAVQSVLIETQQILALLRRGDAASPESGAPSPSAGDVTALVETFREIGMDVTAYVNALDECVLSAAVGLTVYRVIQEALTNAHRYGDGSTRLELFRSGETLTVTVSNLRSSAPDRVPTRHGYGLVGMRERVTAVGGRLRVDSDEQSFRVAATVPTIGGSCQ
jgi:signal transduction histidine kinase